MYHKWPKENVKVVAKKVIECLAQVLKEQPLYPHI